MAVRTLRYLQIAGVLLLLSLLLFAYPAARLCSWLDLSPGVTAAITLPLFLSQLVARVLLRHRRSRLAFVLRGVADFYLGLSPALLGLVLLGELALSLTAWSPAVLALVILAASGGVGLWGLYRAWHPQTVVVKLCSPRVDRPRRFAQISDVHIGSRSSRFLANVMRSVSELRPEFLCITGDFIDQPGIGPEKLQPLADFPGPIYYCTGNHERYEDLDAIVHRLQSLGVEVLRNRSVVADGMQIIGIDDHDSSQQVARVLPFLPVEDSLYSILLYHRPQGLDVARRHGIDLKLSGHTHAGQIVPFHLAVNKVFEYTSGLYRDGDTHLYVNEGTGTWGPTLRLGTRSEITLFELEPG